MLKKKLDWTSMLPFDMLVLKETLIQYNNCCPLYKTMLNLLLTWRPVGPTQYYFR